MKTVAFVAPVLREGTLRFLHALAAIDGIRLSVISHDSPARLSPAVKARIAGWARMGEGLSAGAILFGVQELAAQMGKPDRLLGVLEQLQVPLASVRQKLGIPGMGVESANNFRDKARMKSALRAAGLPCARHCLTTSVGEALDFVRDVGLPVVLKPPAGAGAVATVRLDTEGDVRSLVSQWSPSAANPVLLEEFVQGDERSFEVVSIEGEPVWHSLTLYDPQPLHVLRNPWIQWTVTLPREVESPQFDDVREVGFAALKVLGQQTGLSHMEWFRRRDGSIAINEIAARPPGAQIMGLMGYSTGVDMFDRWAKLMTHGTFTPPVRTHAAGAAFFRAMGDGKVTGIRGLDEAQAAVGHLVVEAKLPRIGQHRSRSYEGDGWAVVRAERTETVQHAIRTLVGTVRVDVGI